MKTFLLFFQLFLCLGFCLHAQEVSWSAFQNEEEILLNKSSRFYLVLTNGVNKKPTFREIKKEEFSAVPHTAKAVWMVFDVQGNFRDSLFVYTKHRIPKMDLFKKEGAHYQKIGHTGFANQLRSADIPDEYNAFMLPMESSGRYFLKLSPERYSLGIPKIYISPHLYEDKESKIVSKVSLITAGFQLAIFVCALVFMGLNYRRKISQLLVFFLLLNVTDIFYFISRYYILNLELPMFSFTNSQVWNILGDLNILLYYIFYRKFFNIKRKSFTWFFIQFGIFFWIVQIFIELSNFHDPFWINFAVFYLNCASIVDFVILVVIAGYILKNRMNRAYYRIGFVGLVFMLFSAAEIAYPHLFGYTDWVGLSNFSFALLQFCVLINILSFVSAIIHNTVLVENEKNAMKQRLLYQEIEKQKSLQQEREKISRDMHDELGAGISAIKLQSEILRKQMEGKTLHTEEIDHLISISEEMNTSMREMLWTLNSKSDSVANLAGYMAHFCEVFFSKTDISLQVQNRISNNETNVNYEFRRNILLVLKEACNNIIKHSEAQRVLVDMEEKKSSFILKIQDNGKGFQQQDYLGYGLTNMKTRMEMIDGNFTIQSGTNGTTILVKVEIPQS